MARLSRADRKRINSRVALTNQEVELPVEVVQPVADTSATPASKTLRTTRRLGTLTADTVNYTAEYAIISHDLRRIAFWGVLLMTAVLVLGYSGLV